jgi:hypothetical protein
MAAVPPILEMAKNAKQKKKEKTYNTGDSLVVTHPTTGPALACLTMGERTGSRIFRWLWSYVFSSVMNHTISPFSYTRLHSSRGSFHGDKPAFSLYAAVKPVGIIH